MALRIEAEDNPARTKHELVLLDRCHPFDAHSGGRARSLASQVGASGDAVLAKTRR
jgi:hypothetical protein